MAGTWYNWAVNVMNLPEYLYTDADGQIRFKGHRLRLIDVAARYEDGHSPETIVLDHYPTLPLATVYSAIGFYLENEADVKALLAENQRALEEVASASKGTPTLVELRRRLQSKREAEAS